MLTLMGNFLSDNDDLRFYVERAIDWARLAELCEDGFAQPDGFRSAAEAVDAYRETLAMVGALVADRVAPHSAAIEKDPPRLVGGEVVEPPALRAIFEEFAQLGLHGVAVPRELGGQNLPLMVNMIISELLARADVSLMGHYGFHGGVALALLLYSVNEGTTRYDLEKRQLVETRFGDAIREILAGEAWGSMDITEPDAGSDMAQLKTRGVLGADGVWRVSGQKIFITSGHAKYHVVIARTEPDEGKTAGLHGLSTFLVKAYEDTPGGRVRHVKIDRLEEKLGHHGSATAALSFDDVPAELIGQRGDGFRQMLVLMNGARLSVGFEGIGLSEAALRLARAYAAERRSMGKTIDRHEMIADALDEIETDVQALRALAFHGAYHEELAQRLDRSLKLGLVSDPLEVERTRRELRRHQKASRRVTPLLKHRAAEKAVEIARRAIQLHGGAGYITEYGVEKLLRDALVLPIYEGTSQIQALMAMKDTLGAVMRNPQAFVTKMAEARWRGLSARDPLEKRVAKLESMQHATVQALLARTAGDKLRSVREIPVTQWASSLFRSWDPKRDFAFAMLHAERLCEVLTDVAIAEVLLAQAQRYPERRELLERFLERAELRVRSNHDRVAETGERLVAKLHGKEAERSTGT